MLNTFRTLIYPSTGASDYSVELPHWSYCSWFDVCWSFGVVGLEWYPCCMLKHNYTDTTPKQPHRNSNTHRTNTTNVVIQQNGHKQPEASACNTDTTPTQPHWNSNTHRSKNNTTNVVIQQNSHKLLVMDILMSETRWSHKKWNKVASDIKFVFYSSIITMIHGPINILFIWCLCDRASLIQ